MGDAGAGGGGGGGGGVGFTTGGVFAVSLAGVTGSSVLVLLPLLFNGITLASPVFSYSSRLRVVDGGLLKL